MLATRWRVGETDLMAFYPDFWVATATASPVIALSSMLAFRELLVQSPNVKARARNVRLIAWAAYVINALNLAFQAVVLLNSLQTRFRE